MAEATKTETGSLAALYGQRMTLAEYAQLSETNERHELINGVLIVSPSPMDVHQLDAGDLYFNFRLMLADNGIGGELRFAPLDVYLGDEGAVQPDLFWVGPGGRCTLGQDGYWYGPPDLVIEVILPSSGYRDRVEKFELYQAHGVREYWLLDPAVRVLEVYSLVEGRFQRVGGYGLHQAFESPVLGGLKIDLAAVFPAKKGADAAP